MRPWPRWRAALNEPVNSQADEAGGWPAQPVAARVGWLRGLYDWAMAQALRPYALWTLALIAFVESSVFPIPPDVLLIPMVLAAPTRAWLIAGVCTLSSVAGGIAGYAIGALLFETLGQPILEFYGLMDRYADVQALYRRYDVWAVGIAGLTPIPYKVFTLSAGVFAISFPVFVVASAASRETNALRLMAALW